MTSKKNNILWRSRTYNKLSQNINYNQGSERNKDGTYTESIIIIQDVVLTNAKQFK